MKFFLAVPLLALAVLVGVLSFQKSPDHSVVEGLGTKVAQMYSQKCATPAGICMWPPSPVGYPCNCGPYRGQIIP